MSSLTARVAYTEAQLIRYLRHIGLPSPITFIESCAFSPLLNLTALLRYQLAAVSFDSLVLHYSVHHDVVLEEAALFEKVVGMGEKVDFLPLADVWGRKNLFVTRRTCFEPSFLFNMGQGLGKRGGYCMENNTFFAAVLRGLGYEVLTTGARVSNAANGIFDGGFIGWSHEVLLVRIEGKRYMVDVGFGPQGPVRPLPLEEGAEIPGIAPGSLRLVKDNIAPNTDPDQKLWIYQSRETPDSPWLTNYCFTELEFLPTDFEVMSFRTSTSRNSWFTYRLVCVKMVLSESMVEIIGTITLMGNTLKRKIGGVTEELRTFGTEGDRVEALEKWFSIKLTEEERDGIRGMVSKLPD